MPSLAPAIFGVLVLVTVVLVRNPSAGALVDITPEPTQVASSEPAPTDKFLAYQLEHPHGTWAPMLSGFVPGMTDEPMLPEPDWAKTIAVVPAADRRDGPVTLRGADSVWQVGSAPEYGARLWDAFYVWTALGGPTDPSEPVLGTYVVNATDPATLALDAVYPCPRLIGRLTIVGATEEVVSFSSESGVSGSFDLTSKFWTFDDTQATATLP
jgi:hypothetical protein